MIDAELLKILCCPETHQPVAMADAAMLLSLNERIQRGAAKNGAGRPVTDRCDGGLVRQDGAVLYPIRQSIPILLKEEAISMRM